MSSSFWPGGAPRGGREGGDKVAGFELDGLVAGRRCEAGLQSVTGEEAGGALAADLRSQCKRVRCPS
jgi:hypothetical protein